MANIGKFNVTTTWTKIADITSTTFTDGKKYILQNVDYPTIMLCESATQPTGDVGFRANTDEKVLYTCKTGAYLWLKSYKGTGSFNVSEEE